MSRFPKGTSVTSWSIIDSAPNNGGLVAEGEGRTSLQYAWSSALTAALKKHGGVAHITVVVVRKK